MVTWSSYVCAASLKNQILKIPLHTDIETVIKVPVTMVTVSLYMKQWLYWFYLWKLVHPMFFNAED